MLPVIYSSLVFAQDQGGGTTQATGGPQQDFNFWSSAALEYNISKKFRLNLEQQLRIDDNIGFSSTFTQLGVRYRLHRFIRFGADYRFVVRDGRNRHRISGDLFFRYRKKKFPLRFNYRMRFQRTYRFNNPRNFLRNKLAISYNLSRLIDPFIAGELYYRIRNKPNEFQKYRLDFGLDWRLSKKSDLSTFYRLQNEINVNNPALDHVIGMGYSYTLR